MSDLEPLLAQPLDLLVCELSHFLAEELFDYLRDRPIKQVAFVHLGRPYWNRFEATRRQAARKLPGPRLTFPKDQAVIRF